MMHDHEKLGAFYLGRPWQDGAALDAPLLYDAADLCTHGVIIGMTGSGKTGLGISLIEEAAIDHVPVIAIDPKGDLGNLLLQFPNLAPADFLPWVDPQAARSAGQTVEAHAAAQAALWRQGLAAWGQGPERIARLGAAAEFALYTPGSTAGRPISVLGSLAAPPATLRDDADLYRQHLQGVATGLLSLAGIDADPVASREHLLLSTVLDQRWQRGEGTDLPGLIAAVQQPGVTKIGVLDLDAFYPAKERFALAMRLNTLVATPGFEAWLAGEPLRADTLFYTADGRPKVSVISIAHLNDAERMFFVTLLLNAVIAWMRSQPGTASLRALLYMDEIAGYLPPVAMPPSKPPLLTLLKQARAFGLGVVLAGQNPVDFDYKALSNAGTWMIGRLQTAQDRERVREGLRSAAAGLDPDWLDTQLGNLQKRCFLLHNIHESAPVVFQTRWALCWLRGPLTRDDIRRLAASAPAVAAAPEAAHAAPAGGGERTPALFPGIATAYLAAQRLPEQDATLIYQPRLLGAARVAYVSARHGVDMSRELVLALEPEGAVTDWHHAEVLDIDVATLEQAAEPDALFAPWPGRIPDTAAIRREQVQFGRWLRSDAPLILWHSRALRLSSTPGETQAQFRIRLQQQAREVRDREVAALRRKYAARFSALEERERRARQAIDREAAQARGARVDTLASVGAAVLGALLGRKAVSVSSVTRAGSAVRKAGHAARQSADVRRAEETVDHIRKQIAELEARVAAEVAALETLHDAHAEALEEITIRPRAGDISVRFFGIGWLPWIEDAHGTRHPAWQAVASGDRVSA